MINQKIFIEQPFENYTILRYLENKLDNVGLSRVDVRRTPVATRITLWVLNPGRIIGRRGSTINLITSELKREFPDIQEPQINIMEINKPFLEPKIVAKKAAHFIEIGRRIRSVLHRLMGDIQRAGAIGAEIIASGKIGAKGARSRRLRVSFGYIPKAGDVVKFVRESHIHANTKSGVIGLFVRIVPPEVVFPDMKLKMEREQERLKMATRTVTADDSQDKPDEKKDDDKKVGTETKEKKDEVKKEEQSKTGKGKAVDKKAVKKVSHPPKESKEKKETEAKSEKNETKPKSEDKGPKKEPEKEEPKEKEKVKE